MGKDALERLFESSSSSSNMSQYTLDEQMEVSEDDFMESMSKESKDTLLQRIQKVDLDEDQNIKPTEENMTSKDEDNTDTEDSFLEDDKIENIENIEEREVEEDSTNEKPKRGRGRPRKNPLPENTQEVKDNVNESVSTGSTKVDSIDIFMDSLSRDLIEDLKKTNYTMRNFSRPQMLVILDYLSKKINP